eukprot:1156951-Pelagomonas_calceolata.AAC.6
MSNFAGGHWVSVLVGGPVRQVWVQKEGPLPACPCCKLLPPLWHRVAEWASHGDNLILRARGPSLIDYKEYHTDVSVRFQLELTPEKMAEWEAAGIESKLKLTSKFATSECSLAVLIADPVSARRRCWLGIGGSDMLLSRSGCDVQHQRNPA